VEHSLNIPVQGNCVEEAFLYNMIPPERLPAGATVYIHGQFF
jgi:hypothetical protein